MDDSIGAYLSELKDENDRLIERLSTVEIEKKTNRRETVSTTRTTVEAATSNNIDQSTVTPNQSSA